MKVTVVVTAGILGLAALAASARASAKDEEARMIMISPPAELDEAVDERSNDRNERIFAFYTTTSITRLATTTITALSTCLSIIAGTACQGRRKKSIFSNLDILDDFAQLPIDLVGSQSEAEELVADPSVGHKVVEGRDGKKLTIWSTNFTTLTITSTSYLAGTTVTATALCSAPGLAAGCFGK